MQRQRPRSRGIALALMTVLAACHGDELVHDASGVFEAREIMISAETTGTILEMSVSEGQTLAAGAVAVRLDCSQLDLQRQQIVATGTAVDLRTTEARPQVDVLREQALSQEKHLAVQLEQLRVLEREQARFTELVKANAAPAKQLADIEGQVAVLRRQVDAARSQIAITKQQVRSTNEQVSLQNRAIGSERAPIAARVSQIDDQIQRCTVKNPLGGTVLSTYAETYEFATPGKPLYKIADLSTMTLRAYITGDQIANLKLGQAVNVFVDAGAKAFRNLPGTLTWISDKAEFTPKTIQTKRERSNLVYAVKITVPNDGTLKIGMYGEVNFAHE